MNIGRRFLLLGVSLVAPLILAGAMLLFLATKANAQSNDPEPGIEIPPFHVVEEGENLTYIADQYQVSVFALQTVNNIRAGDVLRVGQELRIPGGEGESILTIYNVQSGDSLSTIARSFNTSVDALVESNRMIHPDYFPSFGQVLIVVSETGSEEPEPITGSVHIVGPGESLLQIAVQHNISPSELAAMNDLTYPVKLFTGQRLRIPGEGVYQDLPGYWTNITVRPQLPSQGETLVIHVSNYLDGQPFGAFAGQDLNFIPDGDGHVALIGIDAFMEPGVYELELGGSGSRPWAKINQTIPVYSSNYPQQQIEVPEDQAALLDPEVRSSEDDFLETIFSNFTDEKKWSGLFQVPVTDTIVTAYYGGGRSYNEGPVTIYHTGTDFSGDIGTPILAAADGVVVFSDPLELRGDTVIIDHGLGVMTAYYHLSERFVELDDLVEQGQMVGKGGSTGLSTGPHLHWDLRIMNTPVDGLIWTKEAFP